MLADDHSDDQLTRLRARVAALEAKRDELADALAEADHQARRERDGLERAGGRAPALESRLALLDEGRELTRQALEGTEAELAAAEAALEEAEGY
ncbi:MAG: hypothetical protein AAF495_22630 [Pseudomonadota bacterium]